MKTYYFTMRQNNSGGYFIKNDDVREIVVIEATTPEMASILAKDIVDEYSEYCSCCGERWYTKFDKLDGQDVPSYSQKRITPESLAGTALAKSAIVYHLDGRKEIISANERECVFDVNKKRERENIAEVLK